MPRSAAAILVGTILASGIGLVAPGTAAAAPVLAGTPCAAGTPVPGDFDGDGRADLTIARIGQLDRVEHRWAPGAGGAAAWLEIDDYLSSADLDGDVCADAVARVHDSPALYFGTPDGLDTANPVTLALPQQPGPDDVWIPNFTVAATRHDGISQVIVAGSLQDEDWFHSPFVDVFTLDAAGVPGTPQVIDLSALGASSGEVYPLTADGRVVAIGSPADTVAGRSSAGAVYLFSSDATDPAGLVFRTRLTQNSKGIPGSAETGDGFGSSLSLRDGRLAIGVPDETLGQAKQAGLVQPILWNEAGATYTTYRAIHQGTTGVPGTNETSDRFGSTVVVTRGLTASGSYDIAIGAPNEDVGSKADAGSITVANIAQTIFRKYTQASRGVPGTVESGDRFGSAIGILRTSKTVDTLLIGAPGEDIGRCRDGGYAVRSDGGKLGSPTTWTKLAAPGCDSQHTFWGLSFAR